MRYLKEPEFTQLMAFLYYGGVKEPKEERGSRGRSQSLKMEDSQIAAIPPPSPSIPRSGRRCKVCNADNGLRICARIYSHGIW